MREKLEAALVQPLQELRNGNWSEKAIVDIIIDTLMQPTFGMWEAGFVVGGAMSKEIYRAMIEAARDGG